MPVSLFPSMLRSIRLSDLPHDPSVRLKASIEVLDKLVVGRSTNHSLRGLLQPPRILHCSLLHFVLSQSQTALAVHLHDLPSLRLCPHPGARDLCHHCGHDRRGKVMHEARICLKELVLFRNVSDRGYWLDTDYINLLLLHSIQHSTLSDVCRKCRKPPRTHAGSLCHRRHEHGKRREEEVRRSVS